MKQHTAPIIIIGDETSVLEKVSLGTSSYNEDWIQNLCFSNPSLLPVEELEPTFGGMLPICRELPVDSGYIDLIYINEYGFITIGECKLWRNPEARRKVIGQILDYAKDLTKWDYDKFETECLKARKKSERSLFDLVNDYYPEIEESSFIDQVQKNLKKGRFLLTIIGDGIRGNMEELASYIHMNGNMNFTLALIELPVFKNPDNGVMVVTPRVLAKTKEIERVIYKVADDKFEEAKTDTKEKTSSKTVSEKVFHERLQEAIGQEKAKEFEEFVEELSSDLNLIPKLGRGKRLSLNLKAADGTMNFASIQETGEVWYYGVVNKAEEVGDKSIGIEYLKNTAKLVGGNFDDSLKMWSWGVRRQGKYIDIREYLQVKDKWKEVISDTQEKLNRLEEYD